MANKKTATKNKRRKTADTKLTFDSMDVFALVQCILRESYLNISEDLKYYAEKVKYFNRQKKAIREYLQALRCVKSRFLSAAYEQHLDTAAPTADQAKQLTKLLQLNAHAFKVGPCEVELGLPDRVPARKINTLDEIRDDIAKWEEKLATLGDDAQLANVDLQNILQKQQQTLQMMSNISKMDHNTAMAVIRKIGY